MQRLVPVQHEPLYNSRVLDCYKDLVISDDNGESRFSNSVLLSIASHKLGDIVSGLCNHDSDQSMILCGYSDGIVQYLDEFIRTGTISLFGQNTKEIGQIIEELKCDFMDLGVYAPSDLWLSATIATSHSRKHVQREAQSIETKAKECIAEDDKDNVVVNGLRNDTNGSSLCPEDKIGPDGYFLPTALCKFNKQDPKLSELCCPICVDATITSPLNFAFHMKDFHPGDVHRVPKKFTCKKCKKEFDSIKRFLIHASKPVCPKLRPGYDEKKPRGLTHLRGVFADPFSFIQLTETRACIYTCPLCHQKFEQYQMGWFRHIMVLHKEHKSCLAKIFQCENCSNKFTAGNYVKHKNSGFCSSSGYCKECGKYFSTSEKLRSHMTCHLDEKFSCEKCGKVLKSQRRLKHHMRNNHGDPVACDQCGRLFKNRTFLNLHVLSMHTEEKDKPHKCSMCGKGFGRKQHMLIHERNHRNEKPFKCRFCDYASSSVGNRWIHEKNVHKDLAPTKLKQQ